MSRLILPLLLSLIFLSCQQNRPVPQVLVFSKTNGFRHASIEAGVEAVRQLGVANGFSVTTTEDSAIIKEEYLQKFAAVIFLNTSGDVLNNWQQADFQRFIEAGGGFVGVHGAAATEYDWKWYGKLVGAFLEDHPDVQEAEINVAKATHPATQSLPSSWQHSDEWYNFRPVPAADKVLTNTSSQYSIKRKTQPGSLEKLALNVPAAARWDYEGKPFLPAAATVLLTLDETTYDGGKHGASHPIAWAQEYEGGRSFYTGLGHTLACYKDSLFLTQLLGGIRFAIGENKLDYSKAKTHRIPPEDRFVRTILAQNLDEPMELDVFPNGRVIFIERKGAIKVYDPASDTVTTVCQFPVYHENEEGLLGLAIDPKWQENKWIYLYYSPPKGPRRNRLSRFVFDKNMLHVSTEKILLEVPEMEGCCHSAGSLAFDSKGNLFLSTGDNTNPFESDGFAPIDERPGRALWDAQKSSANANDLRGKILRITPQSAEGETYTIPEGNLFPPGTPGTRPEIFVMGCRNPFRISVDSKTNVLYWGDVGPDAGKDGKLRGPKGYDTVNRAAKAGNYGWPLVRGNHIYHDFNFAQNKPGPLFDPERPVNDSPNNTGIRELPPVQPPLIWYSYDESLEFPWTATGGKNPMAGPVFHAAEYGIRNAEYGMGGDSAFRIPYSAFPPYFEGKLFIYEWMRNWIFVVTLDEAGHFLQADPFLPSEKFVRPMDMAFGPDGALYVLEYGTQWFAANPDARLNRIEYAAGNRRPVARIEATPAIGSDPLTVRFSASASEDADGDPLRYEWILRNGQVKMNEPSFEYTFNFPGIYPVVLKATDSHGLSSKTNSEIVVGNTPPSIIWELEGNQSFFWENAEIPYRLHVADPEDGSLASGTLDARRVKISIDYLPEGQDVAAIEIGHQMQSAIGSLQFSGGKLLIEKNDCGTCHAEDRKINGPSYINIANRYYGSEFAVQSLTEKVIKGGAGSWGETAMSAHPNLTRKEAEDIVKYILSLAGEVQASAALPFEGIYKTVAPEGNEEGAYIFQASYRDRGSRGAPSLSGREVIVLRYPKIEAEQFTTASKGVRKKWVEDSDTVVVTDLFHGRFLGFEKMDLTRVSGIRLGFYEPEKMFEGSEVEVRLDAPNGEPAGKVALRNGVGEAPVILLENINGLHRLFLVFKNEKEREREIGKLDWLFFEKSGANFQAKANF